jgi:large subunit ribosomal protein L13
MIVIDAKDLICGRIATFAAKKALLGSKIIIVNSEHAVLTGHKKKILADYQRKRAMGTWATGPFYHRSADRLLRRMIRGMLPYKQGKGKDAFGRIMCYLGVPEEFKDQKMKTVNGAHVSKLPNLKFMHLQELSALLGGRSGE